jgi:hypothetical protein
MMHEMMSPSPVAVANGTSASVADHADTENGMNHNHSHNQHHQYADHIAPAYDAVLYQIDTLKTMRKENTRKFASLDFSNCSDILIDNLFPPKPQKGPYLPPLRFRKSSARIREWRRMVTGQQKQVFADDDQQPTALSSTEYVELKPKSKRKPKRKDMDDFDELNDDDDANALDEPKKLKVNIAVHHQDMPVHSTTSSTRLMSANCDFSYYFLQQDPPSQPNTEMKKPPRKKKRPDTDDRSLELAVDNTSFNNNSLTREEMQLNQEAQKMLRLEQYSAVGSVVDTDNDNEDDSADVDFLYRGQPVDRTALQQQARNYAQQQKKSVRFFETDSEDEEEKDAEQRNLQANRKLRGLRKKEHMTHEDSLGLDGEPEEFDNGGSIFGQTTGASHATWVECDKCKKWRRLRGVVDEKKLPLKWFCSMNRNDPSRSRCSAPEEAYETPATAESAADSRARKHFRVWVRRIQTNEQYESRQPPLTRGKKRQLVSSSKEPYEWVRCCNPSCGKWRAVLRIMSAKSHVMDRTVNGEWYCVMNTWDEKMASCAAPQENLPAIGCPDWCMQDDNGN